jgi:ABC-2 type transport system ATP-binding protein
MNHALIIKDLYKTYRNGKTALNGLNLEVHEGDFFALLGQNGAGKSTTIGILTSLIRKDSGKVWILGHDIDTEHAQAKALMGIVPQEINFNPFDNILKILIYQAGYYGIRKQDAQERAEYFLNKMQLWSQRKQYIGQLSGGMKRRLLIARSLMNDPNLLILDEPTAGVDIEIRHAIWDFLQELNQAGKTIILTTHYLEEAEHLCRNVAIVHQGKVVMNSSMTHLVCQLEHRHFIFSSVQPLPEILHLQSASYAKVSAIQAEIILYESYTLSAFFAECAEQKIEIRDIQAKFNRLETFFLQTIQPEEVE